MFAHSISVLPLLRGKKPESFARQEQPSSGLAGCFAPYYGSYKLQTFVRFDHHDGSDYEEYDFLCRNAM
jgi:hypothetical protein